MKTRRDRRIDWEEEYLGDEFEVNGGTINRKHVDIIGNAETKPGASALHASEGT